jgi:hypothetical protein
METLQLFSTPIAIDDWTEHAQVADALCKQFIEANQIKKQDFLTFYSPEAEYFKSLILQSAKQYAHSVGQTTGYIVLESSWFRIIENPNYFVPNHHHPGCWSAGTFYFTEGQGDLVFMDARGSVDFGQQWVQDMHGNWHGNCTDYYYKPKKYHTVHFPSYLKHMVLPDQNVLRNRIALSWNIARTDDFSLIEKMKLPKDLVLALDNNR